MRAAAARGYRATMTNLPLHGVTATQLDPEPEEARAQIVAAVGAADEGARLRDVAARHPAVLEAWARLAMVSLDAGDPVAAYAFARTGYHRGLDRIRKAGWKGHGPVPWTHEPNRGFLLAVEALRRASQAIGERDEVERLRTFLMELDPDDHLQVRSGEAG